VTDYLKRLDQIAAEDRWPTVRHWMFDAPLPFFEELRNERPILSTPEATLVARFNDCKEVLDRFESFSVALYEPKQGFLNFPRCIWKVDVRPHSALGYRPPAPQAIVPLDRRPSMH